MSSQEEKDVLYSYMLSFDLFGERHRSFRAFCAMPPAAENSDRESSRDKNTPGRADAGAVAMIMVHGGGKVSWAGCSIHQ